MQLLILFLIIYLISALGTYIHLKIATGEKGIWYYMEIDAVAVLFIVFPIINTYCAILFWVIHYPIKK